MDFRKKYQYEGTEGTLDGSTLPGLLRRLAKDATGGAVAGIFGLPGNIVFGLIAFASMGDAGVGLGIMAAMYSTIIVCLVTSCLGNSPGMISGPKAATCLIFASVATQSGVLNTGQNTALCLALPFLVVFMSGLIQLLAGLFRLGNIVKYIPYPVLAGILNGTVVVVLLEQVWPVLGVEKQASLADLLAVLPRALPLNTVLVLFCALLVYLIPRWFPGLPGTLAAIPLGSAVYHLLEKAGFQGMMGPVMGQVAYLPPDFGYARGMLEVITDGTPLRLMPVLVSAAATIAILNSVGTLLAVLSIQSRRHARPDNNRLMMAEGLGNMVSACFGGLAASGYVLRSRINHQAGGRTRLSGLFYALTVFVCIAFFSPLIGKIPKAVITGILLMALIGIFDRWSLDLFKKFIFGSPRIRKNNASNMAVLLMVMMVCILYHPVAAVLLGVLVSVVLFVMEMSKSLVRREYRSNAVHSKMYRNEKYMELLRRHGHRIAVLELEGPIFFGSADLLATRIEALAADGADWVILDMKRVSTIDGTGAQIIVRSIRTMEKKKRVVAVSYVPDESAILQALADAGLGKEDRNRLFFRDTDMALEAFEERLLEEVCPELDPRDEFHLSSFAILKGLSKRQMEIFSSYLSSRGFVLGETVFSQGDPGDSLFFIVKGSVDVNINISVGGTSRQKRLQILSAGTIFGEMALIDGKERSADIVAREDLVCLEMGVAPYRELTRRHPDIAVQMLTGMARVLSGRLRSSHIMISELEI